MGTGDHASAGLRARSSTHLVLDVTRRGRERRGDVKPNGQPQPQAPGAVHSCWPMVGQGQKSVHCVPFGAGSRRVRSPCSRETHAKGMVMSATARCDRGGCPATALHHLDLYGQDFHFCGHHWNELAPSLSRQTVTAPPSERVPETNRMPATDLVRQVGVDR